MKVAELAKSLGTTADTVRYYTRLGLLKPAKSVNGYKSQHQISHIHYMYINNKGHACNINECVRVSIVLSRIFHIVHHLKLLTW